MFTHKYGSHTLCSSCFPISLCTCDLMPVVCIYENFGLFCRIPAIIKWLLPLTLTLRTDVSILVVELRPTYINVFVNLWTYVFGLMWICELMYLDLCEFVNLYIWTCVNLWYEHISMCLKYVLYVIYCVAYDIMCLIFHFCVFIFFFWKRVKNVGTHVLKVKNVGTVELIVQSAQTSAGHISSTATWPRRT
jgi:hypothetical protein